jgi:hypothetical protein
LRDRETNALVCARDQRYFDVTIPGQGYFLRGQLATELNGR